MTTCNTCSSSIPDPAEEWPDDNGGTICQECWETVSARMWWFSIGALFGLILCGWPWHHRFSRYSRYSRYRAGADSNGNRVPPPPAPPGPEFYKRRKPPTPPQP
jgi:hypothetical protein